MRTLILTCNTGEGHNSSAYAIQEIYQLNGEFCEICDSLGFLSKRISKFIGKSHANIYRHTPKVFDKGYALSEKYDSIFAEGSFLYRLLAFGTKRLYRYVVNFGIDNIICVHPFSAIMVTEMCSLYNLKIKTSIVSTDYTCAPGVNCSDVDIYFIPHSRLVDDFVVCGIPKDKIKPSGIPVKQCFIKERSKEYARDTLSLPYDKKIIVMCCGSMGAGPIEKVSIELEKKLSDNDMLIIICGSNTHLYNKLLPCASEKVKIVGYTRQMCDYMAACDLFMTKPGGISITEASLMRVPMFFVKAVAGCELRNREFFDKLRCAKIIEHNDDLAEEAIKLLYSDNELSALRENLRSEFGSNAAQYIYDTLSE